MKISVDTLNLLVLLGDTRAKWLLKNSDLYVFRDAKPYVQCDALFRVSERNHLFS